MNRELSSTEEELIRWMLEHGNLESQTFVHQLEKAEATPWRCPCGCASINLSIRDETNSVGSMHVIADFLFGMEQDLSGIFVFETGGILAGLEVYGLAGDAPQTLPSIEALRPFPNTQAGT